MQRSDPPGFAAIAADAKWAERLGPQATRLFHGRGGCYPGFEWLTIDYFEPVLWIVLYKAVPRPRWEDVVSELCMALQPHCPVAVAQHRYDRRAPLEQLWGQLPAEVAAREGDMRFQLTFSGRQNPGYFMDMRPAREWLAARADGKRVLNLFAYTCAFSVAAATAGARAVVNIDMSRSAIRQGQVNHHRNGLAAGDRIRFFAHDIFRSWGKLRRLGPYDIIICDPPSSQVGSFDAQRDYMRVVGRLDALLAPQGDVLACLNAPYLGEDFLSEVFAGNSAGLRRVARLPGRGDFPERYPGRALKVVHYQRRQEGSGGFA